MNLWNFWDPTKTTTWCNLYFWPAF